MLEGGAPGEEVGGGEGMDGAVAIEQIHGAGSAIPGHGDDGEGGRAVGGAGGQEDQQGHVGAEGFPQQLFIRLDDGEGAVVLAGRVAHGLAVEASLGRGIGKAFLDLSGSEADAVGGEERRDEGLVGAVGQDIDGGDMAEGAAGVLEGGMGGKAGASAGEEQEDGKEQGGERKFPEKRRDWGIPESVHGLEASAGSFLHLL